MSSALKAFCVRHYGEGGKGTGVTVVMARQESTARTFVKAHLDGQPEGYRKYQSAELLEVELLVDSSDFHSFPVSVQESGVVAEYFYPPGEEHECRVVYLGCGANMLARKLDGLQSTKNDGRGVECVRSISTWLRRGDLTSARAVAQNEADKVRNYPDIVAALREIGFWYEISFD